MDENGNNFAVLEPDEPDEPEESMDWTTGDEIAFVRRLYKQKNLRAMSDYRRMLPYRSFYGAGMHVDVNLVRWTLNSLIDALESELL